MPQRVRITREQRAVDAYEINAILTRYCRGIDRADADLLRSCFHDTASEVRDGVVLLRDEFVPVTITRTLQRYEVIMHVLGNVSIDFTGDDSARVESYAVAYGIGHDRADPQLNRTVGVRYVDDVERRADREWRIATRSVVFDWIRTGPLDVPGESPAAAGRRDRTDPSYLPVPAPAAHLATGRARP